MNYKSRMTLGKNGLRSSARTRRLAACCLILLGITIQSFAQDRSDGRTMLPDLTVGQVYPRDFGLLVSLVNLGTATSGPCEVTLFVYDGRGVRLWQDKQQLKSLSPHSSEQLVFTAGRRQWAGSSFQVIVDSGNTVKELNETNNRSAMATSPLGSGDDRVTPAKTDPEKAATDSRSVDLAAINVFQAVEGKKNVIHGVIRNLGSEPYSGFRGKRQATITLAILKDGEESERTLGTVRVPDISAGGQQVIAFPSPSDFAHVHEYRLTLTISGEDSDAANNSKTKTSAGFSSGGGSPTADLEAAEVARILEGGIARIKGLVRNVSSQRYKGDREVRLYFIDQSGNKEKSTLIASRTIKNIAAGEQWEIIGDLPTSLKKVKHFLLRLSISPGDANSGNDEKTRPFGNL